MSLSSLCLFTALVAPSGLFEGPAEVGFGVELNLGSLLVRRESTNPATGASSESWDSEPLYQGSIKFSLGFARSPLSMVAGFGLNNGPSAILSQGFQTISPLAHAGFNLRIYQFDRESALYLYPRYEINFGDFLGSPVHEGRLNLFWRISYIELGLGAGMSHNPKIKDGMATASPQLVFAGYFGVFYEDIVSFFGKKKKMDPGQRILNRSTGSPDGSDGPRNFN